MDSADRNARNRKRMPSIEGLEGRQLMSASAPADVAVVAATTRDSRGVTVTYNVDAAAAGQPIRFSVLRSADATLDANDVTLG
jgi:hypothetical protein